MKYLEIYNADDIKALTSPRANEVKLGEKLQVLHLKEDEDLESALQQHPAQFVVLGLPEDIGVRANFGRPGTATCWEYTLKSLLNTQCNSFTDARNILVLGHVDFEDLMLEAEQTKDVTLLRTLVGKIDERVIPIVYGIVKAGKIPVVIGGGHNNTYPLLKASAKALYDAGPTTGNYINCINCDAHTDLRPPEGRHSGNGFSYALREGFLDKYYMLGLHEPYITAYMEQLFAGHRERIGWCTFEDIVVREKLNLTEAIQQAIDHTTGFCAIELDMDCIQHLPSSAQTATGLQPNDARRFIYMAAQRTQAVYLHITEAAPALARAEDGNATAKLVAALILDFVKAAKTIE